MKYVRAVATVCSLTCMLALADARASEFEGRMTAMWRCEQWTLENPSWSGNPFDVIATVTFTHSSTNEQRTTQMFYAGDNRW